MRFPELSLSITTSLIVAALVLVSPQTSVAANVSASESPDRAVVVIEGGGSTHPFTTPSAACDGGRPQYVQALVDAGLPTFTAPGFTNSAGSTTGRTGCPPQPPVELQWNTAAFPTQAGESVLGFLGFLNATYGYTTFDLVGYSYGGVVARATVAAMENQPAAGTLAPAFSYAAEAVTAGVKIASITTLNSPHLGSPAYDIAADPRAFMKPVTQAWGKTFADHSKSLLAFQRADGAGAIQFLQTSAHAKRNPSSWDSQQVGVLNGIPLTLIAGDYTPESCRKNRPIKNCDPDKGLKTDGTVPVYSQLMLPCPKVCPTPPGAVFIPRGLLPDTRVVRKTFPTVHSTYDTNGYGVPEILSVSKNPAAIAYLIETVTKAWRQDGVIVGS